jgi:hypothetical protein
MSLWPEECIVRLGSIRVADNSPEIQITLRNRVVAIRALLRLCGVPDDPRYAILAFRMMPSPNEIEHV